jgi:type I restriction enzyme, S subunit
MTEFLEPLPSTWVSAKISDVAEVNPKLDKARIPDNLEVSFVPMPAVEELTGRIDLTASRRFSEVKKGYTAFQEGDVLFAKITPCMENGKMAIVPALRNGHGFGSTEFHVLRPFAGIDARYLYYFVSSERFRVHAEHNMTGAVGQRRVATSYLSDQRIPIAPPEEQRRIVTKIDDLFSELDKGVEALTTARKQLELYHLVVLHRAVCTKDGALYPFKALDELIGPIGQGWSPKCELNRPPREGEWAILKTTAVQPMSYLAHECKPLPVELEPRVGIEVRDGDLLMTRKGPRPRTGVVCYVEKARPHSMMCDTVYRFRAVEAIVLPEYLEIALNAPSVRQEIDARKSGISESGISLNHGRIRSLPVPVPIDKAVQERIVQTLRERLSLIENVAAVVKDQEARVNALRQAILKQAFSGQLLARDPKDEPAAALLERFRSAREGTTAKKDLTTKNGRKKAA